MGSGHKNKFIPRDISWLSFNDRVLQEAADKTVPLIERIKFLGIFSNNMDEFFRVRVASLKRMTGLGGKAKAAIGESPKKILKQIQQTVIEQQDRFESIYQSISRELESKKVFIINENQLSVTQGKQVKKFFHEKVRPALVPIMIDHAPKFPYLKDRAIYLAVKMSRKDKSKNPKYSLIEVPRDEISRFFILPKIQENKYIILLDDVIRYCLEDIFSIFQYDTFEAYTIKMTRDAELDIESDLSISFKEKIVKGLMQRKKGDPVRLVHDSSMPKDLLNFLLKKMNLHNGENIIPGGRYHNFKDFISFPKDGLTDMIYPSLEPLLHKDLNPNDSIFKVLKQKDVLIHYPYQSFNHIIDLLREASIDPKVTSIKITLYRVARNSNIVNTLINAVKNGKAVTVVVEIQARFDEEANIYWANKLQEEGATVIYGVPGLKIHSKLFLISRKEDKEIVHYAHIGTGNFNESTSNLYTDKSLLTADKQITHEVSKVFHFFSNNFKVGSYKHLLVSPFFMRKRLLQLINTEIKNAKAGKKAYLILKMNSLVDEEMIRKLYQASDAGVKINLIIRGICSLIPGVKGMSENIEAISIVDKYLEHARVFIFCNDGDEKYYISSADWMMRNFDFRTEVACPIYDKEIQKELKDIINIQLRENTKARIINEEQDNQYKRNKLKENVRAQDAVYNYLKKKLK